MNMKLLLMDLDGTLLDSLYFKQQLFKLVANAYDVKKTFVIQTYEANTIPITVDSWLDSFIQTISNVSKKKPDVAKLKHAIFDELRVNILQLNFLRNFDGFKVILTFGNEQFQKEKIACVQLKRFVDDIIITQQKKTDFFDSLVQYDKLIIKETEYTSVTVVDDNVAFLNHINQKYPWITTFEKDDLISND